MNDNHFEMSSENSLDIAVIGMSGVFPGAENKDQFWENLCNGVESREILKDEELLREGVPSEVLQNPDFVKSAYLLENYKGFDANFFGISPNEAICMDPQHRIFLECCWQVFEDAGYDPLKYDGDIGVFAGAAMNTYLAEILSKNKKFLESVNFQQIMIGNDKDFLPTLVSYKLNLRGPSINVNTACSTSLVAIHLARQSLLLGECDMALAGGVSIIFSNRKGYMYIQDGIQSPDGHCRAFDAKARGTVWGDGSGVVLLKKLSNAVKDRDHIYAVIKGSAINNDGANKVGFTAPSVEGQKQVIIDALAVSDISADEISYVEAHGTGTQLGDPVEMAALTQAYEIDTDKKQFCAIGSVKTNIGHLNSAAGIAGLIKCILSLKNKMIPPSLNFKTPNPKIDFDNSPFYVNTELSELKKGIGPLRVGISSMGIGGTNCHIILEEKPEFADQRTDEGVPGEYTLLFSARSQKELERIKDNILVYLQTHPDLSIIDIAYTLQCGRHFFSHREALQCFTIQEAIDILQNRRSDLLSNEESANDIETPTLNNKLLQSWLKGEDVDWSILYVNESPCRVPLPVYPFERQEYWLASDKEINYPVVNSQNEDYFEKFSDMADWFSVPCWDYSPLPITAKNNDKKNYLLFADNTQIGDSIARKLKKQGHSIVVAAIGKNYKQKSIFSFILNPSDPGGYGQMLNALNESNWLPDRILFFWPLDVKDDIENILEPDSFIRQQESGFVSIFYLIKALSKYIVEKSFDFIAFTNDVFNVTGREQLCITNSTIPGICLVIKQEHNTVNSRIIDFSLTEKNTIDTDEVTAYLINEIENGSGNFLCSYRGVKRYVRKYKHIRIEADAPQYNPIRENGIYIVYGGFEGIGFLVAEHIIKVKGGKLLLMEDDTFPPADEWKNRLTENDPITIKIKNAIKLTELGAEYLGSITHLRDNPELLNDIENKYGKINGIIHAPGSSNAKRARSIMDSDLEFWKKNYEEVAYSFIILDKIFKSRDLDFRILLNSLGSVLGGFGFMHISSISNYIKSYIYEQSRMIQPTWGIQCWDSWVIEWELFRKIMPEKFFKRVEPSILTHEEGIQSFDRLFSLKNIIEVEISASNLSNRYNRWVTMNSHQIQENMDSQHKSLRPDLKTSYKAPRNPTEKKLEFIFCKLLGIEKVGIDDDFFDLGGHSLLALNLAAELRKNFLADFSHHHFYDYPTIAKISEHLIGDRNMTKKSIIN